MSHYTAKELAGLPDMPGTERAVRDKAEREDWPWQKRAGRGGGREYPLASLPATTRLHLARATAATLPAAIAPDISAEEKAQQRLEARAQSLATFDRLPPWQKKSASAKLQIIRSCAEYIQAAGLPRTHGQNCYAHEYNLGRIDVAPWVRSEIRQLHAGTLRGWIRTEHNLGVMGLVDCYGNRKGQSKIDTNPQLKGTLVALMLDKPHIKARHAWEVLQATCADAPSLSIKSVERFMTAWKADNQQAFTLATNPDAYKNKYQAAFGSRSEGIDGPNQRWEIDATPADLLLVDGRHKIIGICDVGTRRLIYLVTRTERATDNAAAVRRALMAWGVPAGGLMVTDNGNPYKSDHFMRVMSDLEIRQHFCLPFSGDEKPFVERGFKTFSHDLVELLPGYCGHSVADRKAIEARKSFAQRLRDPDDVIEMSMTAEQLQTFCDRWCAAYHSRPHSELGMTPNEVVSRWPHVIHRISDERALDMLLAEAPKRRGQLPTVQKKGIRLDGGTYIHADLQEFIGQQVRVLYDPSDLGRIIVQTMNADGCWEFTCIAEDPDRTGISRAEVAAVARARQNQHKTEMRHHAREAKKAIAQVDIVTAVLAHREKTAAEAAANVSHFPRPGVEYTTPGLVAASEARAALDGHHATPAASLEIEAARQRLADEMAAPRATVFDIPYEPAEKYRLWSSIDGMLANGAEVSDEELRFYEAFRGSRVWKVFKGIDDDIYSLRRE